MTRPTAIDPTHPESKCQRCGEGNIVWHAPSPLWNAVMRNPATGEDRFGLVCPVCFVILAEEAGLRNDTGRRLAWCLRPDDLDVTGLWTGSSGRIWDSGRCLWVEPGSAEATAAAEQRLRSELAEKVRALPEVAEWDERRGMVGAPRWRPALSKSAILAILDAPVGPTTGRTWPSRDELAAMSSAEVNAFFESVGSDWRVADFPAPASSDTPDRHYAAATPTPVTPSPEGA